MLACAFIILAYRLVAAALAPAFRPTAPAEAPEKQPGATPAAADVPFAPSQVRRTSARVRFATGAVQEVFGPPPPAHSRAAGLEYHDIWREGEIAQLDVPVGVTLRFDGQRTGSMELGDGDACQDGACEGIERVALEQDVLVGLRQMREGGSSRRLLSDTGKEAHASPSADPTAPMVLRIPSSRVWPLDAVTLVTQFSVSRLGRVERTLAEWDGPVSLAIYLTDQSDIPLLEDYLLADPARLAAFRTVALTVVKPDYAVSEPALVARLRYPINRLRNLALALAPTLYVLVTDADFVPSPRMHELLASRGVPLIAHPTLHTASPTLRRTAVAISAFMLSSAPNTTFPSTPALLAAALDAHPPLASLTDANAGHGPSLPSLLTPPPTLRSPAHPAKWWSYDICYEPQWEPYYLLHRPSHPLYDERFSDQGGDKQSHALLLNALGYEFKALRDVWFMHPPKGAVDEQWPSARLVDPNAPAEDHDAAHFSVAQRDQKRFRYFEDYVPEIQRRFGWAFRWPGGCPAGVVGVRSFGRARAGVVFGM